MASLGEMGRPIGIAVDSDGFVYVTNAVVILVF